MHNSSDTHEKTNPRSPRGCRSPFTWLVFCVLLALVYHYVVAPEVGNARYGKELGDCIHQVHDVWFAIVAYYDAHGDLPVDELNRFYPQACLDEFMPNARSLSQHYVFNPNVTATNLTVDDPNALVAVVFDAPGNHRSGAFSRSEHAIVLLSNGNVEIYEGSPDVYANWAKAVSEGRDDATQFPQGLPYD